MPKKTHAKPKAKILPFPKAPLARPAGPAYEPRPDIDIVWFVVWIDFDDGRVYVCGSSEEKYSFETYDKAKEWLDHYFPDSKEHAVCPLAVPTPIG